MESLVRRLIGRRPAQRSDEVGPPGAPAEPLLEAAPADPSLVPMITLADLLVGLLEYRDPFFRGGSSLTGLTAVAVGRRLGLTAQQLQQLALAALLRDVGRLVLRGQLVTRPTAQPEPEERRAIERHVELGLQILEGVDLPGGVRDAVRHHHEHWNGSGYPDGLAGRAIPLAARILCVADSFAAMIRPRPYRTPLRVGAAVEELRRDAGTRYDPEVVDALVELLDSPERPIFGTSPGHHVLVVHDDEARATVVSAWLCQHGYLADVVVDPATLEQRLQRVPVAALVVAAETRAWDPAAFVARLRTDQRNAALPIVAIDAGDDARRRAMLAAGVEVSLTAGAHLTELQAALAAVVQRTDPGWSESPVEPAAVGGTPWHALHGSLTDFPLAWVLQVLKYDTRTAEVVVQGAEGGGSIFIQRGDPWDARTVSASGEEALREMLRWPEGHFHVRLDTTPRERTIHTGLMPFLLDQAVAMDHDGFFGTVGS